MTNRQMPASHHYLPRQKTIFDSAFFTISIFCQAKAKIIEKAQFTNVNEHF